MVGVTFIQSGWAIAPIIGWRAHNSKAVNHPVQPICITAAALGLGLLRGPSSSGHFALASRWSLGGPFAVYPNKVKALQLTDHPRGTLSTQASHT